MSTPVQRLNRTALSILLVCIVLGVFGFIYIFGYNQSTTSSANYYDVTFDYDSKLNNKSVRALNGTKVAEPNIPAVDGYTFVGWYSDKGYQSVFSFNQKIDHSITLYAKFNANIYHITYSLGFGEFILGSYATQYSIDSPTFLLPTATKSGYYFMGWYNSLNGGTVVNYVVKGSSSNMTLYPRFSSSIDYNNYTRITVLHEIKLPGEDKYILHKSEQILGLLGSFINVYSLDIPFYTPNTTHRTELISSGLVVTFRYTPVKWSVSFYDGELLLSTQLVEHTTSAIPPVLFYETSKTYQWDIDFSDVRSHLVVHSIVSQI